MTHSISVLWQQGVLSGEHLVKVGIGLTRAGVLAPLRPDRLARLLWRAWHEGANFATLLTSAAARFPERIAVEDDLGAVSFADLDRRVQAMAAALAADGLGVGDTVALMCRNHRGFVEGLLAACRLGADVLLLNTEFPAPQLRQVLDRHELSLVIHDGEFNGLFARAGYDGRRLLADSQGAPGSLCALVNRQSPAPGPRPQGRVIILTSGATGAPKGAPRRTPPLAALGPMATLFNTLPLISGETMLIATPLFHSFGLTFLAVALALGSTTVLCRRFDTERVAQRLVLHQVRTLVVVPVMLQRLLDIPAVRQFRYSFRHVSTVISAGSPLGAALAARWMDTHGDNLFNLYGSTEAGGVALATPEDLRAAPGTVGRMPLGAEVRILDSMGCALPAGLPGHICVRSGMLFEGYVGGGGKPMINGYMNTGDIGYLDAEGRLFVEGREDDMIVSGGENVFPLEVEEWLAAYPGVAEVAVVGVTDAEFGQRLKAFVVEAEGAGLCAGVLKAFLRDRIARYKVPRDIVLVDALPRNAGGQVLRRQLATR